MARSVRHLRNNERVALPDDSPVASSVTGAPGRAAPAALGAAAVLMIVAATAMPWATYKSDSAGTVHFGGGELGRAALLLAVTELALALCLGLKPAAFVSMAAVAVGVGSLGVAAALALHSIALANTVYRRAPGPSQSAYGLGSGIGLLAAVGMIAIAAVTMGHQVRRRGVQRPITRLLPSRGRNRMRSRSVHLPHAGPGEPSHLPALLSCPEPPLGQSRRTPLGGQYLCPSAPQGRCPRPGWSCH
jgi:hypothetical protein